MKPYDGELRKAAEEFKVICAKYDCAGAVLFVSPTHAEFVNVIEASWSVASIQGDGNIRFRSKREDFPSKERQDYCTGATAHVFTSMIEWSRTFNEAMTSVIQQLNGQMRIMWEAWDEPDSVPGDGK